MRLSLWHSLPVLFACVAMGCEVGLYKGPDRPDDQGVSGPAPPEDFHCERATERHHEDRNGDKKPDYIVHLTTGGETICHSEDSNFDGKIDAWTQYDHGKPVRHARDPDGSGKYVIAPHEEDAGAPTGPR